MSTTFYQSQRPRKRESEAYREKEREGGKEGGREGGKGQWGEGALLVNYCHCIDIIHVYTREVYTYTMSKRVKMTKYGLMFIQ